MISGLGRPQKILKSSLVFCKDLIVSGVVLTSLFYFGLCHFAQVTDLREAGLGFQMGSCWFF